MSTRFNACSVHAVLCAAVGAGGASVGTGGGAEGVGAAGGARSSSYTSVGAAPPDFLRTTTRTAETNASRAITTMTRGRPSPKKPTAGVATKPSLN
eukprot:scaffold85263_cov60-Phaeocystis_antarctica.AAC.1